MVKILKYLILKFKDPYIAKLLKNSSWTLIFRILGHILAYIFTLLIANKLGSSTLGIFAISITVLHTFVTIGKLGYEVTFLRLVAKHINNQSYLITLHRKMSVVLLVVGFLLTNLLFIGSYPIANTIFGKPYLNIYFKIVSIGIIPWIFIYFNSEGLKGLGRFKQFSFLQNGGIYLFATLSILSVMFFWDVTFIVPQWYHIGGIYTVALISLYWWYQSVANIPISKHVNTISIINITKKSLPFLGSDLLVMLMGTFDVLLLGIIASNSDVGIYSVAIKIGMLMPIISLAIQNVISPQIANYYNDKEMDKLRHTIQRASKISVLLSLPIIGVIYLFPHLILQIFGESFVKATTVLAIIGFGQIINILSGPINTVMQMTDKQKSYFLIVLLTTIVSIILNIILIPLYGIIGAAIARAITLIVLNISLYFLIWHHYGFFPTSLKLSIK